MKRTDRNIDAISMPSDVENESKVLDNSLKQEQLDSQKQDREERKKYADAIFQMLSVYLIIILIIILSCGYELNYFYLSDNVIIALLTTMSANIIGLFAIVANYLFKKNS